MRATPLLACTLAAALALSGMADAVPVNPSTAAVQVTLQVPLPQSITVRVLRADGQVLAVIGPVSAAAGPVTVPWSGGRGPGATGSMVPDGDYRLEGVAAAGTILPTTPATVSVDATPPHPVLDPPTPSVPMAPGDSIPLRAGGADEVRAVVRRLGANGPVLATGAWKPAGTSLALPIALRSRNIVGLVSVTAVGRDAAGNIGQSAPVLWAAQPAAGTPIVVRRITTTRPLVALTIDDGYGPREAARMITAARSAGVTITFCFNAINRSMWSASFRTMLAKAVRDGVLEVCSHGYSHRTGTSTSESAGVQDLTWNQSWDRIAGYPTAPFYRPPYGAYGPGLRAAAQRLGYRYVLLWDVDTNDWRGPSASTIVQRAVGGARRGSIILMHTKPNTAAAFPDIIRGLRAKGLRPVGLGELFSAGRPG